MPPQPSARLVQRAMITALLTSAACREPRTAPPDGAEATRATRLALARLHGGFDITPDTTPWVRRVAAQDATRAMLSATGLFLADHPEGCPTVATLAHDGLLNPGTDANDPWGRPYTIACAAGSARVCSLGADGLAGTPDDVCTPRER